MHSNAETFIFQEFADFYGLVAVTKSLRDSVISIESIKPVVEKTKMRMISLLHRNCQCQLSRPNTAGNELQLLVQKSCNTEDNVCFALVTTENAIIFQNFTTLKQNKKVK